jgi:D-threo-aldose 1-dehydrogenase
MVDRAPASGTLRAMPGARAAGPPCPTKDPPMITAIDPFALVPLGGTPLTVTRIGLGLREIGRDAERNQTMLLRAMELGIRHLDVAPTYGRGLAEQRLGEFLPAVDRDRLVVSTKVGQLLRPPDQRRRVLHAVSETFTGGRAGLEAFGRRAGRVLRPARPTRTVTTPSRGPGPNPSPATPAPSVPAGPAAPTVVPVCDYSYDGVMRGLEESLSRMATDRVDLVFIHDPDLHHRQAVRGAYRALDALRRAGTITAVGVGMNHTEPLVRFADEGDFDAFLVAGRYTLLDQSAADRLFPVAAQRGIAIIAAGVFHGGLLADPSPGAVYNYAPATTEVVRRAQQRQAVCERHGVSIKAAALQLPFWHPAVTSVLLGATSADELDECVDLIRTPLPSGLWADLKAEGLLAPDVPVPA